MSRCPYCGSEFEDREELRGLLLSFAQRQIFLHLLDKEPQAVITEELYHNKRCVPVEINRIRKELKHHNSNIRIKSVRRLGYQITRVPV